MAKIHYAGFWRRVAAALIDTVLVVLLIGPIVTAIYGTGYWLGENSGLMGALFQYLLPAVVVIIFWIYKSATPGKMVMGAKIIDARTGGPPSPGQCVVRYLCYYVSMIPLMLGIIWVAFDRQKRGWHDLIAGTMVIVPPRDEPPVPGQSSGEQ